MTEDRGPFRNVEFIDRHAAVHAQMIGAVELLKEWKWWRPIIAGGALWSWAAGNVANDVDIFAKSTWWSRWRAKSMYGQSTIDAATVNPKINDGYDNFTTGKGLYVFRTTLPNHPTKVDFVLSKRGNYGYGSPGVNQSIFDYTHVQVAYSLNWFSVEGANAYADGKLHRLHHDARDRNYVLGKVQTSLWNNPEAPKKLMRVMETLSEISGKPLSNPKKFPLFIE